MNIPANSTGGAFEAHGASRGTPALVLSSPGGAAANVWDVCLLCRPAGACPPARQTHGSRRGLPSNAAPQLKSRGQHSPNLTHF